VRAIGHPLDLTLIRSTFERAQTKVAGYPSRRDAQKQQGNAAFFRMWVLEGLNLARTGYIFDLSFTEMKQALRSSLPQLQEVIEIDGAISPIEMRRYLGAALVGEDVNFIEWLAQLPKANYTLPAIEISQAGYLLVQAQQAGASGERGEFDFLQKEFAAALTPKKLKVNSKSEKEIYEPLSALLQSISNGNQAAFEKAWAEKGIAWNKKYSRPSEKANSEGILDFETLGIGKIAQTFGLTVPGTNSYAPVSLLAASSKSA
jgi:hypothetical protein